MSTLPRRAISIEDVARRAGVSPTTVSQALNGKGRVSQQTRLRVEQAAKAMGYHGSAIARRLASGVGGGVLALHVAARDNPTVVWDVEFFTTLMTAAATAGLSHGYWLTLAPASGGDAGPDGLPADGAIVVDPLIDDPLVRRFEDRDIPVVTVGRSSREPSSRRGWVDNDHNAGARAMLEHLRAQGARAIALITGPETNSYTLDTRTAYQLWAAEHHSNAMICTAGSGLSEQAGYEATARIFAGGWRPDAIYATVDRLALGSLHAVMDRGLSVPGDVLIAGLSDSQSARLATPPLTALDLHPELLGRRAAEMLITLVEGGNPAARQRLIPAQVVARQSTQPG